MLNWFHIIPLYFSTLPLLLWEYLYAKEKPETVPFIVKDHELLRNKSCSTIWMYTEQAKEILMFLDLSLMRSCHDMVKQMDILNIYLQLLE